MEVLERVNSISVTSRRSSPIGKEFFTLELTLGADVSGLTEEEKKAYIKQLYDYAGEEVDSQLAETAKSLKVDKN